MQRVQNLAVFFLDLHSGNLLLTIKLFTVWSSRLGCKKMFCKILSESSTGRWAVLQLPCCPSKQGELSENILKNLFHSLPPQTVKCKLTLQVLHLLPKHDLRLLDAADRVLRRGPLRLSEESPDAQQRQLLQSQRRWIRLRHQFCAATALQLFHRSEQQVLTGTG